MYIIKKKYKFLAKKKFGQHFLFNKKIIKKIIKFINLNYFDLVLEIGPGLGSLTLNIINKINNIYAVEIDKDMINFLIKHSIIGSKIKIFRQNAIYLNLKNFFLKNNQNLFRILGSLPYNVSVKIILNLILNFNNNIKDMYFIIQKELAERITASINTKIYGRLSIIVQYYCKIYKLIKILPKYFIPIPKVDSFFIKLIPYKILPYNTININIIKYITNKSFNNRRKILKNNLKLIFNNKELLSLKINPNLRAENISIKKYCKLSNLLFYKNKYKI
ncbi:16S rRNA (adenine(1518)-N(6)/adenine(1519)-N(6))-dimethyltransferase RsmA [Candidatus Annandia pinicola]|uniref:16S rRNA (adenine(1518)-N(6)/adenine(1519)-N(6))- dimethyltransferase RsmA n=1 Tax=Candidatus Annandia pinicola TaxID=1345117 RepID=UPI001D00D865|nr:16S rRNA (adenine(1518)-N(6)/adenine(1519)-N(6))-dimethyltransferase RsmA [Candidatus Annandia pinicola]UDG80526.1 Ribosomal RNA small subunit methyltransferase A [Candidatus Annandia pinicola]